MDSISPNSFNWWSIFPYYLDIPLNPQSPDIALIHQLTLNPGNFPGITLIIPQTDPTRNPDFFQPETRPEKNFEIDLIQDKKNGILIVDSLEFWFCLRNKEIFFCRIYTECVWKIKRPSPVERPSPLERPFERGLKNRAACRSIRENTVFTFLFFFLGIWDFLYVGDISKKYSESIVFQFVNV